MARTRQKDSGQGSTVGTGGADARSTRVVQDGRLVRKDGRVKTTQLLSSGLVRELAALAGWLGKERSEVVEDALAAYLPRFAAVKGMRRVSEAEAVTGPAGPGAKEETKPAGAGEGGEVASTKGL
jgi:hypothetical protein